MLNKSEVAIAEIDKLVDVSWQVLAIVGGYCVITC